MLISSFIVSSGDIQSSNKDKNKLLPENLLPLTMFILNENDNYAFNIQHSLYIVHAKENASSHMAHKGTQ